MNVRTYFMRRNKTKVHNSSFMRKETMLRVPVISCELSCEPIVFRDSKRTVFEVVQLLQLFVLQI